jgi:glycolate oxidase
VQVCRSLGIPIVSRGAGTGISGGAIPHPDGVLLVLSRMRRVLELDPLARTATVEPGVRNLHVSECAEPHGLFYAPDPSSQLICSIGGMSRRTLAASTA